ncbi:MAG: hypothetical protein HY684_04150 [Chloroflexi bacterium]|nr:hypothetical protein [Chloroflexota bacterium]
MILHRWIVATSIAALVLLLAGCATPGEEARISLREWKLEIAQTKRGSGDVVFLVANNGSATHALRIEGPGIQRQTRNIEPGGSDVLSVRLERGTYELYCPIDRHKDRGITIKLQVGEPQL